MRSSTVEVQDAFATSASHNLSDDTRNGDDGAEQELSWEGATIWKGVPTRNSQTKCPSRARTREGHPRCGGRGKEQL